MSKFYSEQFKRDAVALYENNENLSLAVAAAELGGQPCFITSVEKRTRHW
ncbi:hypothetical protein FRC0549_00511 [Corynebacterium diphtheriae]|nr:hypothetical protein FRC0549_00511 [Corynebacterium diphtheriae]